MIDYQIISDSVKYYEHLGYERIESPWYIPRKISEVTAPSGYPFFTIQEKGDVLVASGEQSLLSLYNHGFLPKGRFQTITPCFREETVGVWNHKYFLKNELMITDSVTKKDLEDITEHAFSFFEKQLGHGDLKLVQIDTDAFDIFYKNIELGSYGIRKCEFLTWVYGTGVAEPRLSRVKNLK